MSDCDAVHAVPATVKTDRIKQPLNLRMDLATIRRLKMHALAHGTTVSALVTRLVESHLGTVTEDSRS